MIKRIYRKSAIILALVAAGALFYNEGKLLSSVVVGGLLALVNLRGIAKSVKGLLGSEKAAGKMVFFSFLRLGALAAVLVILFKRELVNPIGILIGLTIVFTLIVLEGWREARREANEEEAKREADINYPRGKQGKEGDMISHS